MEFWEEEKMPLWVKILPVLGIPFGFLLGFIICSL